MDVLGDAAQMGIVVLGDERDSHRVVRLPLKKLPLRDVAALGKKAATAPS